MTTSFRRTPRESRRHVRISLSFCWFITPWIVRYAIRLASATSRISATGTGMTRVGMSRSKTFPPRRIWAPMFFCIPPDVLCVLAASDFATKWRGPGELGLIQRGSHDEIDIPRAHDGTPLQLLDNKLAGNVVDICPVGALISKDFLFKSRPWFMKKVNSVCPGCSVGCNITVEFKEDGVYRLKPRYHADINEHWMCDDGRPRLRICQ